MFWKNPENLTDRQRAKLEWNAKTDSDLYRVYPPQRLLTDDLQTVRSRSRRSARQLDRLGPPITGGLLRPAPKTHQHPPPRDPRLDRIRLSNGLIESVNTKIRLITRVAFGFAGPDALIALATLNLGGHRPILPGR